MHGFQKRAIDMMRQWDSIAKSIIASPRNNSFIDRAIWPNISFKTRYNWWFGFDACHSIDLRYSEVQYRTHRPYAIEVVGVNSDNAGVQVPHNHPLIKHLDKWCFSHYGRPYRKPGARWKRGRNHNTNAHGTYYFRNRADAAAFKFHFHQATLTGSGNILNGEALEY